MFNKDDGSDDWFFKFLIVAMIISGITSLAFTLRPHTVYQPAPSPIVVYDCPAQK